MPTKSGKREFRNFSLVGFTATAMDYMILNALTFFLGVPILGANIISALLTSLYSYVLNRKVVFDTIAHSEKKSLAIYTGALLISVFVIQTVIIWVFGHGVTDAWVGALGIQGQMQEVLGNNVAKALAGFASLGWNFYIQRNYVFRSSSTDDN